MVTCVGGGTAAVVNVGAEGGAEVEATDDSLLAAGGVVTTGFTSRGVGAGRGSDSAFDSALTLGLSFFFVPLPALLGLAAGAGPSAAAGGCAADCFSYSSSTDQK